MKRILSVLIGLCLLMPIGSYAGGKKATGKMSVQVREAIVRTTPNYVGTRAGGVTFATEVKVIGEEGNWYKIESPAGWVPKSALTKNKVKIDSDKKYASGTVKHDEVALAGKGFNPQVEAQFKKDNQNLAAAYVTVDEIENFTASEGELRAFMSAGKLSFR